MNRIPAASPARRLLLTALVMLVSACSREASDPSHGHDASHAAHEAAHESSHDDGGAHSTTIPKDIAEAAGIRTAVVGPGTIAETISLYGTIGADRTRMREVKARFPGVIREVKRGVGDSVRVGDALAVVESNESLRSYTITAPIAGVITQRHAEPDEHTETTALFEIADFSRVWAELKVFQRDRTRMRVGQPVRVIAEGGPSATGAIEYIAPAGERNSQSLTARVVLDNASAQWTPGQFVEGRVAVSEVSVPLVVPLSAVQTLGNDPVVFVHESTSYEAHPVTLGRRDTEQAEVLQGLQPGAAVVVANSYLIKADLEKSSASHDH
jgi:cobalt-zinc-cadmium efflux system membrane fusion protein